MNTSQRHVVPLTASLLALAVSGVVRGADESDGAEAVYSPLLPARVAADSRWQGMYSGALQLGLGYTSDDSYMFGQYNGLHEEGATLIGNLRWRDEGDGASYWRAELNDLGLDTRSGSLTWGRRDRLRLELGFDSQLQVRNDSGRTPFRGGDTQLVLPEGWSSGASTGAWSGLDAALRSFDRELERHTLSAALEMRLNERWRLDASLSREDKEGTTDLAGAIYADAATADAVMLPAPVDFRTTEFDLGLSYSGDRLHLQGRIDYSDFDNRDQQLSWQNPYDGYGPRVAYPAGFGALALAPDNDQWRGRLSGQYLFSTSVRWQFDGSYAVASQDQRFLDYTVNPALQVDSPPSRASLDGEVEIATLNTSLHLQPWRELGVELFYRARERDYDTPRDGYRYNRGDATDQPGQALAVYNTGHDYLSQSGGVEGHLRLPLRSKLSGGYTYEKIERENAAVEETEEDRYHLTYRIRPWSNASARLFLAYGNRSADTYRWDQRYYALLDVELINATPDNQRYINHPLLSQYHLANRERSEGNLDLNWQPATRWDLGLNLRWLDDNFDKSYLGLYSAESAGLQVTANFAASEGLSAGVYAGFDWYESQQLGRAFRGGPEKDAFDIYPPLPQASDRSRDWDLEATDESVSLGANLRWQASERLAFEAEYSFVDTDSKQRLKTYGAADLQAENLPAVETRLHHLQASGTWALRDNLSLRLDYQYYRYQSDDWAWQGLAADSIDRVLSFGARNPNEQIHYMGVSAIYRWQ